MNLFIALVISTLEFFVSVSLIKEPSEFYTSPANKIVRSSVKHRNNLKFSRLPHYM